MRRKGEQNAEEQAAKFLERARNLDFNSTDVKVAAAVAGLGLAAVATYLASKKLGNRAKTADGEEVSVAVEPTEYMEGVASVVRRGGNAASFPIGDEAADQRLAEANVNDGGLFLIEDRDLIRSPQADPRYLRAANWAISFARHVLQPHTQEDVRPDPDA
jgi:hypothetical protein